MRVHRLALNLAATAMGVGMLVLAAPSAQATSGGCFIPSFAVSEYHSIFPPTSGDEKICKKQCSQFKKGCNSTASAANKCTSQAGKAFIKYDQQGTCDPIEDKATRKECNQAFKDDQKSFKEFLKSDNADAKDFCKTIGDSCKSDCSGV